MYFEGLLDKHSLVKWPVIEYTLILLIVLYPTGFNSQILSSSNMSFILYL